jgi:predicted GIY-YIG superfamily endonuclease
MEFMEWKTWSNLPLSQRDSLPDRSGIYVVVDAEDEVWYVGQSINIQKRWQGKGHHRYKQLSRTNKKRSYRIYWQFFPSHQLDEKEQLYIHLFKPHLNDTKVKKYVRKAIQPNDEIKRLLKVINKKTTLFPDLRSVVIGYYREEMDREGSVEIKEYLFVIIVINAKDLYGTINNSAQKSLTRKGKNLKESWWIYKSDCGIDEPNTEPTEPVHLLSFMLPEVVYQFVCYPSLIDNLRQNTSYLQQV